MRKIWCSVLPLAAGLLCAGCLVRSVHPWLSDETRVEEPALLGAWRDEQAKTTAVFSGAGADYAIAARD